LATKALTLPNAPAYWVITVMAFKKHFEHQNLSSTTFKVKEYSRAENGFGADQISNILNLTHFLVTCERGREREREFVNIN